ncbi:MAG: hypothetical protein HFE87_07175 [Acutalibacter sp.]|jgi:hypothetical protein|nr:hypothetical protein [Acutalibacter sp.]
MNRKQGITAFYIELLVLILVFLGVILTLTRIFAFAKEESGQAQVLTRAVCLAENAAELVGAAQSPQELLALLNQGDNAQQEADGGVRAWYSRDMQPHWDGDFCVDVSWQEEGRLVESEIAVYWQNGTEPVYTLRTGAYRGGDGA